VVRGEAGLALPVVLILLCLSGLLVVPCLSYASSSLSSGRAIGERMSGLYAADAGVEDTIRCLGQGVPPHTVLSENLNGMAVTMQTETKGHYVLFAGEWVEGVGHNDWLSVIGDMVWDSGAGAYRYTITVTWQAESGTTIHLAEVGARLPIGYSYQPGSAAGFVDNLSLDEPSDTLDGAEAHLLEWEFSPPHPYLDESNPTRTQIFYVIGEGALEDYYSWAVAQRSDIGAISELSGDVYIVIAIATRPEGGKVIATVVAEVMDMEGDISILSWQINPPQE